MEYFGTDTHNLGRYPAILCIFLVPQIYEIQLDAVDCCPRCLQMFRTSRITLDFSDFLQGYALHRLTEHLQVFCKSKTHHVGECNVDIIAVRAQELQKETKMSAFRNCKAGGPTKSSYINLVANPAARNPAGRFKSLLRLHPARAFVQERAYLAFGFG